ncbi:MAG: hypothetical protein JXA25_00770 [Anaerolineales bacterium]|nr:hypothetical protein [Anaerolineales bacterium]
MRLFRALQLRQSEGDPIRIGASAMGWMGEGFAAAMDLVPGMELSMMANAEPGEAYNALTAAGVPAEQIVEAGTPGAAEDALRAGKRVVTADVTLPAQIPTLDLVTDVTWSPATGAKTAMSCIEHGMDVVLINIEADVTVGRILKEKAHQAGVLYSVSSGDEPGCLMELVDFVRSLGYEIITIGKGKNNPLDISATPESVAESARKVDKDPYQVASYVDGTKTMFEMACAANATGCRPMRRGMIGPEADLETAPQIFALEEDGGLSRFPGNVDFVQGSALAGGVFVVVRVEDARIRSDLQYLKVGKGKYYVFFRPYHLWFLEAPVSLARAVLYREVWMEPLDRPVAEVLTVAKRDLVPGETLEGAGGYTCYGLIDLAEEAQRLHALPAGLSTGAKVVRPVRQGEILTWDDVTVEESSTVVRLRREQDRLISGIGA